MANAQPLDDAAIARLREELANGKRPSLVLLSGGAGLPAGSRGQLIRIDDPPQNAEFLHLKVGQDELPFAPEEVGLPGRRKRTAAGSPEDGVAADAAKSPAARSAVAPRSSGSARPAASATSARSVAPTLTRRSEPILEPERPDRRTRAARVVEPPPPPAAPTTSDAVQDTVPSGGAGTGTGAGAGLSAGSSAATGPGEVGPDKPRRPARPSRSGAPPKVTLTLRFADFGWTVEALVAGRREKPQPVPLAAIRAFADQLEDQALRRQLDSTVEACRTEAQKRATTLRAELARLETELAALDD